jgi:hypothetical protein
VVEVDEQVCRGCGDRVDELKARIAELEAELAVERKALQEARDVMLQKIKTGEVQVVDDQGNEIPVHVQDEEADEQEYVAPVHGGVDVDAAGEPQPEVNDEPAKPKKETTCDRLTMVLAELNLPGHVAHPHYGGTSYVWVIEGAERKLAVGEARIKYGFESGFTTLDRTQHWFPETDKRLEDLPIEPEADADLSQYTQGELMDIYRTLKRKYDALVAQQETPAEVA